MSNQIQSYNKHWQDYQKISFRFFFIYFLIQALPFQINFFTHLFSVDLRDIHYGDIFYITRYSPELYVQEESFLNWGFIALIALAGTIVWSFTDKYRENYNLLYYWIRVIARYRLAIGLIGYAFLKLYPLQAPEPSISNLNTHYGDISNWKIFSMSLGIVPGYQSFLGFVELLAALLLLWRKTATIGAFLVVVFTGNVLMSNLAYEGGEHIYSLYLVSFAIFLLAFDAVRLYNLFGRNKAVLPDIFKPVFVSWQRWGRIAARGFIVIFFLLVYGYKTQSAYRNDQYQFPREAGLPNTSGIYNVSEFRINNKELIYSPADSVRWKDVVFEEWSTMSIRVNKPIAIEHVKKEEIHKTDTHRNYEYSGIAGRHYYHYEFANDQLFLQNRNKNYSSDRLTLNYERPSANKIILHGVNENKDSIYVVLDRLPKKYLLKEAANAGRNKPIKL
jgi:hypothetical protein